MTELRVIACSFVVAVFALATSAAAEERAKHSGSIVSVAADDRSFVLAEVGPWQYAMA